MKPNSPFLLFCLTLLSYVCNLSHSADYYSQNCYSKSCGHLTITYPFWIRNLQPDYCGLPLFELSCSNGQTPTLFMGQKSYHVLNISYKAQTLTVATDAGKECSAPFYNFSFARTPFTVSSTNRQIIFSQNCTLALGAGKTKIECAGRKWLVFLGGNYGSSGDQGGFGACRTVVRPVMAYSGAKVEEYSDLLAKGFLLNWIAPDCTACSNSNGQCGYNNDTSNFMCICPDRAHSKSCAKEHANEGLIIGVSTAGGLCLSMVCSGLCFLLYMYRKKKKHSSSTLLDSTASFQQTFKSDPELGGSLHAPIFSYDELYEATNGFHASKELGDGGFGTVYKGKLRDGRVVAVKLLYENNYRRLEQFINEVKILSLLRHQNLVNLYGCTSRRSRELLLVYEFVPNGTVSDHLHGSLASESLLPWKARMSIAIETADALNYLHSVEPQIIHRDVKTSNILLDDSFHVKVADFGLSRLFPLDATHVSTAPQGTPGYVDPEYYQCYQLTEKSDVYSFGVVLMELISSMPAVDITRSRNEINLANRAINKIQRQELHELVDPRLGYQSDCSIKRMISQVAELAFRCLQADGELRPCIKDVLEILRGIAGCGCEKVTCEEVDAALKEEDRLLKSPSPPSPNAVTEGWVSRATTPNSSG